MGVWVCGRAGVGVEECDLCFVIKASVSHNFLELCRSLVPMYVKYQRIPILINIAEYLKLRNTNTSDCILAKSLELQINQPEIMPGFLGTISHNLNRGIFAA